MKTFLSVVTFVAGLAVAILTLFTMMGLGLHRHGSSWAISATSTLLVFAPALVITSLRKKGQLALFGASCGLWSILLFFSLPVYFPGERNDALVTGLSLVGINISNQALPGEPELAKPLLPEALTSQAVLLDPPTELAAHQIALPYEGEGRRLTVELAIQQEDKLLEMDMMLDTGATYTTLPRLVLAALGITLSEKDPTIVLQTANGERSAQLVLVDKLWLGDLAVEGVAIAVCDACASEQTTGLLGLNVTGGYNLNIDADRREVVFTTRKTYNRTLDIKPFLDINATVSRYRGDRVEVEAHIENQSARHISEASVSISCERGEWLVPFQDLEPGVPHESQARLPNHEPCERYQIGLKSASWATTAD